MLNYVKVGIFCCLFVFSGCVFAPVHIRTRVVVQRQLGCEYEYQVSKSEVEKEIQNANKIYWLAGVDFRVETVEFKRAPFDQFTCWRDSLSYPDFISVYYVDSRDLQPYNGLSLYVFFGAVIVTPRNDSVTLAHELGHVLGLLHTFDEDGCADTLPQKEHICQHSGDVNCGNVMNYCCHGRYYITLDQAMRIRRSITRWKGCFTTVGKSALDSYKDNWDINDKW